jgi:hypothetical protein
MGQMTHAVILGVDASGHAASLGDGGLYDLLDKYKAGRGPRPDHPHGDTKNYDVIGFWVAVGASGKDGVPDLDTGFQLDGFLDVPEYREAHQRARAAWATFRPWAAKRGFVFGTPRLWLVQTEVA